MEYNLISVPFVLYLHFNYNYLLLRISKEIKANGILGKRLRDIKLKMK